MVVRHHMMRCMLTANLAVAPTVDNHTHTRACWRVLGLVAIDQFSVLCMQSQDMRFANGTQGRLFWWAPNIDDKKTLPSSHPELLVPAWGKPCLLGRRTSL